ncbi:hypothetical protein GR702_06965 [Novosphingobium sp. FGD1]|jgi:hypothetical protein|uniref:Uncharacterized protein n=1 Tax=Novosphingobium silvae TaxID=2692619 RepID=A0A7X4GF68_9SPHN|nr:hypothetical protein [Novosphingobium silvae]MYL97512.1 hypothetical protein [Novosphingobium silvae]
MIQTTAPTLNAGVSPVAGSAASMAVPGPAGTDFAAILGMPQPAPARPDLFAQAGAMPLATNVAAASLPDAVRGAQDGLAALVLQAGAAASPLPEAAAGARLDGAAKVRAITVAEARPVGPAAIPPVPGSSTLVTAPAAMAAVPMAPAPMAPAPAPLASAPQPEGKDLSRSPAAPVEAIPSPGKSGKGGGNILPSPAAPEEAEGDSPIRSRPAAETPSSDASAVIPAPVQLPASDDAPVAAMQAAAITRPVFVPSAILSNDAPPPAAPERSGSSGRPAVPVPPREAGSPVVGPATRQVSQAPAAPGAIPGSAPVRPAPAASVSAVRFEPIEVVAMPVASAPAMPLAMTAPANTAFVAKAAAPMKQASPENAATVVPQVMTAVAAVPHVAESPAPIVPFTAKAAPVPAEAALPAFVDAPAEAAVAVHPRPAAPSSHAPLPVTPDAVPSAAQSAAPASPSRDARNTPGPAAIPQGTAAAAAPFVKAPEMAAASLPSEPRSEDSPVRAVPSAPAVSVEPRSRDAREGSQAPAAHFAGQPGIAPVPQPVVSAEGIVPAPAAPEAASTLASSPTETPQDFDTLVSRLAEAREAASPHIVRTAMNHAEFGRVSMQFDQTDMGLSVTMASPDPEFTGAVQAAAATMAGNGANGNDQPRQDGQSSQQNGAGQNPASAQGNGGAASFASGGQAQQQARADASGQQSRREGGGFAGRHDQQQQSGTSSRGRDGQRQGSGVYA